MYFYYVVVLCFLQVFRSSNYAYYYIGKKGRKFQLCHQFLAVFLLGRGMVMSLNEFVHRAGLFLDKHYHGYQ